MTATLTIQPRLYQQEAVSAIHSAFEHGIQRQLLSLPTGCGKTIVFAQVINERPGRAIVLAHRDELITQAVEKLRLVDSEMPIGIVKAEHDAVDAPVVVASVQTLARSSRLARLEPNFSTVVVDEAHHVAAKSYQRILSCLGAWHSDGPLVLGVTATPERADRASLGRVFDEIVYQRSMLKMIQDGYLSDLKAVQVLLQVDLDKVRRRGGDFVDTDLGDALHKADAPEHIRDAFIEHAADRKALVFTPTVEMAYDVANIFAESGIATEALDGTTATKERRAILRRLHTGETQVVTNCMVLTEGFDEPSIDCIIVARLTQSRPLYQQMVGRGTRKYLSKDNCLVIDCVGVSTKHKLQTVTTLFDLPDEAMTSGHTVTEAIANKERQQQEALTPDGNLVSIDVDLFARRRLRWVQTERGAWVLPIGQHGTIRLTPDGPETWQAIRIQRDTDPRILGEALPLDYAQGVSEDLARQLGVENLIRVDARWRRDPASSKQIARLRKWRIPIAPGLTKGEAHDMMTARIGDWN